MTRRMTSALLAIAGAGLLALAAPVTADAATGFLVLGDEVHSNPSGCYDAPLEPLVLLNRTDSPVHVFSAAGCRGDLIQIVSPGHSAVVDEGASVHVP